MHSATCDVTSLFRPRRQRWRRWLAALL